MITPVSLFSGNRRVSAHSGRTGPKDFSNPLSAPPEPYVIATANPSALPFTKYLAAINDFFSTPKLSEGFEMAKVPTLTDKMSSYFGSFLGLFTGSIRTVAPAPAPPPPNAPVDFDFDGDGKTDIGRWHATTSEFKVKKSNGGAYATYTLGGSAAKAAPGDFNGDGNTDAGVFYNGGWTYKTGPAAAAQTVTWGMSGDKPVAGDYDGDGKTDFAIFRPSTNYWWVLRSSNGSSYSVNFGTSSDILVQGDYDGDSKTDMAFFRPSTGDWHITGSTSGYYSAHWGSSVDTPVPADYDGDGKTDMAVYRPTTGEWFAYKSSTNNGAYLSATWGSWGDQPVPGYYDGDAKADFAIWRPKTGGWYTINSNDSTYDYQLLGVSGDQAVPSAYIKQVGSAVSGSDVNNARLSAKNATGGLDLYSRNFSWSTGLVDLPGRSGLDMGFGMSYNSLVWLKQGSSVLFDPDTSNVSPGFRLGFPVIEPGYYDDDKDTFAYMMVTPSGGRVEFRQTAVSNTYETADSSYIRLATSGASSPNDPVENITIKVTTRDGTQMGYEWKAGAFRCNQIKDRNGNYITITHNDYGGLSTVTDTTGRVITVNYASGEAPTSITQTWNNSNGSGANGTHTWATFTYTTIQIDTDFSGLSVFGPPDGTFLQVLQKITRADGSHTDFSYNSYGQVWKVSNVAADSTSHVLNHVRTNLESPAASQTDCPRFTETKSFVENFQGGSEVTVNNSITTGQSYSLPGSISGMATKIQVWMSNHPDNLRSNTFVAGSGWQEGLTIATEDCLTASSTCSDRKRWSWTNWTQDNTGVGYPWNPRITETRIGDDSNTKRTTIDYRTVSGVVTYGLPETIKVYDTDLSTVLKQSYTEYNLQKIYTNRRILGLPSKIEISGRDSTGLNLVSKMTYAYDEGNFNDSSLSQNISPTQHDNTDYSSSFITGRGNLTSTTRWDVNYPTTSGYAVTSSRKYNTAGSVVSQTDPRGRVNTVGYNESIMFNDGITNRATFAYPTTFTDPGGFSSTVKYRFDMGALVWARTPTPYSATSSNSYGKTISQTYNDTVGYLVKEKIENAGADAYARYEYGSDGTTVDTYSTVVDANGDSTINGSDEVRTTTLFDGAGRVRMMRTENPGSSGGYIGALTEYDLLGRLKRSTVPTEINSSWNPAGDDYRGMDGSVYIWLWTSSEYDWKGRTTREINTDGTDRLYSYEGCGCAGGEITTIKGEVTEAVDVSGSLQTTKRRTQKVYGDSLGRIFKAENWDLDGGGSAPYSTTKTTFNGRDQAILIREYAGSDSSSIYQDTTRSYDGHARLASAHRPEQSDSSNIPTYTSYTYNTDDTVATITDGRGAVTAFRYGHIDDSLSVEHRPRLTKISYSSPSGSGIPVPGNITYEYDPAGNRKQMIDDTGTLTYSYDELSRLLTETKTFADSLSNAPSGGYKLSYTYHLNGDVKSVKDPFDAVVNYASDKIGRTTAIGGSGFYVDSTQVTSYASNIAYRAFGGVKSMSYSTADQTNISVDYDDRLRPSAYMADSDATPGNIQNKTYTFNDDGTLKTATDVVDASLTQNNQSDFAGRLKKNEFFSGVPGTPKPYTQTVSYDAFNNMTGRSTTLAGYSPANFTAGYTNNRKTSGGYNSATNTYDAAGKITMSYASGDDTRLWTYDASGKVSAWTEYAKWFSGPRMDVGANNTYDGSGRLVKRVDRRRNPANGNTTWVETPEYEIFSSVTGDKITELNSTGQKTETNVYLNGSVIAQQQGQTSGEVVFRHTDPVTTAQRQTDDDGLVNAYGVGKINPEPLGANVTPQESDIQGEGFNYKNSGNASNPEDGCRVDGGPDPGCRSTHQILRQGGSFESSGGVFIFYHIFNAKSGRPAPNKPDVVPGDDEEGPIIINTEVDGGKWETFSAFIAFNLNFEWSNETHVEPRTPNKGKKPCPEQDFNVEGGNGFTSQELTAVVQTAVGEASNKFYANEVEYSMATVINRQSINMAALDEKSNKSIPFNGGTSIMGLLSAPGQYQAYTENGGKQKVDQEKALNEGVLPRGYVCDQLMAAKNFAAGLAGGQWSRDEILERFPFTNNLGKGMAAPRNAFYVEPNTGRIVNGVHRVGDTIFFNVPWKN